MKIKTIKPFIVVTNEAVENMGCFFASDLRRIGVEELYTAEEMEQYRREIIAGIFESYNIFDKDGNRKQLGDLLEG